MELTLFHTVTNSHMYPHTHAYTFYTCTQEINQQNKGLPVKKNLFLNIKQVANFIRNWFEP